MTGAITNRLLREAEEPITLMRKGIGGSLLDVSPLHKISVQKDVQNHTDSLSYQ
jgi:hypothetical protein